MTEVGTASVTVSLGLARLISDAKKATEIIRQQIKDQEVAVKPKIEATGITALANTLKSAYGEAQQFAQSIGVTADQANAAIARIRELNDVGATTAEKYKALKQEFGLTAIQMKNLSDAAKLVEQGLNASVTAIGNNSQNTTALARSLNLTYSEAKQLAQGLGLTASQSSQTVAAIRSLTGAGATADQAFEALEKELGVTRSQFNSLVGAIERSDAALNQAKNSGSGLQNVFAGFAQGLGQQAFFVLQNSIQGAIEKLKEFVGASLSTVVEFDKLNNKLVLATGSTEGAGEAFQFAQEAASKFGLDARVATNSFADLAIAAKGTSIAGEATRQLFVGLSAAFAANGLSAEQQSGAFLALQQIISKGTVSAEELRGQLGERLPGAFQIAARSVGVTTAELGKLLQTGSLTSDEFIPKFAAQLQKEFGGTAVNEAVAGINRLNSQLFQLQLAVGKAIQPAQLAILDTLSAAFEKAGATAKPALDEIQQAIERFANTIKDNPKLVNDLADALGKVSTVLAGGVADGINALTDAIAKNPEAISRFASDIVQTVQTVIDTIKAIGVAIETIASLPGLKQILGVQEAIRQGLLKITDAFAQLIINAESFGEKLSSLPIVKQLLDAVQAAQGLIDKLRGVQAESAKTGIAGAIQPAAQQTATAVKPAAPKSEPKKPEPVKVDVSGTIDQQKAATQALENGLKARQALIQQAVADGKKTEDQARIDELNAQAKYYGERYSLDQSQLTKLKALLAQTKDPKEREKIESQISAIEKDAADSRLKQAQASANAKTQTEKDAAEQQKEIVRQREQAAKDAVKAREEAEKDALARIEAANAKADASIAQSQNQRTTAIKQAQLDGAVTAEEAAKRIEAVELDSIGRTIAARQSELAQIRALRAQGTISAEEAASREGALIQEVGQLNLTRINQEIQAQQAARDAAVKAIEDQYSALEGKLKSASDLLDLQKGSYQSQSDLLGAQSTLQESLNSLAQERLNTQIAIAEASGNQNKVEELKQQSLNLQGQQLEQQFKVQQQQLDLAERIKSIELQREQIQARINVLEAEAAVKKAEAAGASSGEIAALQQVLSLRQQQVDAVQASIAQQDQLNQLARQNLAAQQQISREKQQQQQIQAQAQRQQARSTSSTSTTDQQGDPSTGVRSTRDGVNYVNYSTRSNGSQAPNYDPATQYIGADGRVMSYRVNASGLTNASLDRLRQQPSLNLKSPMAGLQSGRSPQLEAALSLGNKDIANKLDILTAAFKQGLNRPNLTVGSPEAMQAGVEAFNKIGRDQLRSKGW